MTESFTSLFPGLIMIVPLLSRGGPKPQLRMQQGGDVNSRRRAQSLLDEADALLGLKPPGGMPKDSNLGEFVMVDRAAVAQSVGGMFDLSGIPICMQRGVKSSHHH